MKIERLVPDPRRPGSTRVVVDGHPAWTIPADMVRALDLQVGGMIGSAVLERLEAAADEEAAFRSGVRHLERRGHAGGELARKLERKGHPAAAVAAAIARLTELRLLDDAAFARAFVAARAGRGRSPSRMRHDLQSRGVAPEVAAAALGELARDTAAPDPLDRTLTQARRRAESMAALPLLTRRRRLLAFFARRGWSGSEARTHVEAILGGE